ncbi:MAG TPA: glycosyltransferase [Burkholderiaceae bacterium]|nr:glycosyltransferase [Burkholderiaceae bacterium]
MIPKIIHIIWVGDETKRPDNCIRTWVELNPTWTVKVWGNEDLATVGWVNARHMREMAKRELNGVADLMRWEILYAEGGFVVDADSVCVHPLDDELCHAEAFACWENEIARPGVIAAGYVAAQPNNPFIGQIVIDLQAERSVVDRPAWMSVGPMRLTDAHRMHKYANLTIHPSHYFIPRHYTGLAYTGPGKVYADQIWGSTHRSYDELHTRALQGGRPGEGVKSPAITVGICTYNQAQWLGEAIESALAQDYEHFEVLIVDDGSTDATPDVIAAYANNPRVRSVRQDNGGEAAARNTVLAHARCDYIVWLDSDDALLPDALSAHARMARVWPEVAVFYGDLIAMDAEGNTSGRLAYENQAGNGHLLARLVQRNAFPNPGTMIRRETVVAVGGYDEQMRTSCDYDLWTRLAAQRAMFMHIGREVCRYRWHGGNASSREDRIKHHDRIVLEKLLNAHDLPTLCADIDWSQGEVAKAAAFARIGEVFYRLGDLESAHAWLSEAKRSRDGDRLEPAPLVMPA